MITITVDTTKVEEQEQLQTGFSISEMITKHRNDVNTENPEMTEREKAEEVCRRVNKELTDANINAVVGVSDSELPFGIDDVLKMVARAMAPNPALQLREDFKTGLGLTVKHTLDGFQAINADAFMPVTMMASAFIHTLAESINTMIPMADANEDQARQLLFRMATLFMVDHYVNPPHECRCVDMNVRRDEFAADLRAVLDNKGESRLTEIIADYTKVRNKIKNQKVH